MSLEKESGNFDDFNYPGYRLCGSPIKMSDELFSVSLPPMIAFRSAQEKRARSWVILLTQGAESAAPLTANPILYINYKLTNKIK